MNQKGRTLQEAMDNLVNNNTLSFENVCALNDAFGYATATPMQALLKCLKKMKSMIDAGVTIEFYLRENEKSYLNGDNFDETIIKLFDEWVLNEVYKRD